MLKVDPHDPPDRVDETAGLNPKTGAQRWTLKGSHARKVIKHAFSGGRDWAHQRVSFLAPKVNTADPAHVNSGKRTDGRVMAGNVPS